ncbi:hypothetical protein M407DRAFT_4155 [Tulasnella calospora MUT 4182]|uniref:Uncharacterized protein n=1 Tax=Tulasnella calospora MUT 4182 TaxID=1051891 RepID=A0A0C3LGS3_9AGAM|nr:hypothetical protein M407DRAFT_4155 [Tulasnella calospora MUT 4182]
MDFLKISNRQCVASETLFSLLRRVQWSELSLVERGQVLLLLLLACVQVETGRLPDSSTPGRAEHVAQEMTKALNDFTSAIAASDEIGPLDRATSIPIKETTSNVARWIAESNNILTPSSPSGAHDQDVRDIPSQTEDQRLVETRPQSSPRNANIADELAASTSDRRQVADTEQSAIDLSSGAEIRVDSTSAITIDSVLPPEEEDRIFPSPVQQDHSTPSTHDVIPGETLNETSGTTPAAQNVATTAQPPPKKRKRGEVDILDRLQRFRLPQTKSKQPQIRLRKNRRPKLRRLQRKMAATKAQQATEEEEVVDEVDEVDEVEGAGGEGDEREVER